MIKKEKNIIFSNIMLPLSISIVLTYVNYIWIENNLLHIPPSWDQSFYIFLSLSEYDLLGNGDISGFFSFLLNKAPWAAPLVPVTTVPFYFIFGPEIKYAYLVNFLYLFILLSSVFSITKRLSNTKTALLSIFICATFPAFIVFPRDFLYEFPLASTIALSYLFLLKSNSFENRRNSIFFGVFMAASILIKTMGVVFFVFPVLYALIYFIKGDSRIRRNILYSILIFAAIALIYYLPNYKTIFGYLLHFGFGKGSEPYIKGTSSLFSIDNWMLYFKFITARDISIFYLIIFILSLGFFFSRKKQKLSKEYFIVLLWFIAGYLLLSICPNKEERFAFPILPPIAVLMAIHLSKFETKPIKYFLVLLVFIIGIANYAYHTISVRCNYETISAGKYQLFQPVHHTYFFQQDTNIDRNKNWDPTEMVVYMDKFYQKKDEEIRLLVGVDHHFMNYGIMELYTKLGKIKGILRHKFTVLSVSYSTLRENKIKEVMNDCHFIIVKTGFLGPDFSNKNNKKIQSLLKGSSPLRKFDMIDGTEFYIFAGGKFKSAGDRP